jgi:hypothetical protein
VHFDNATDLTGVRYEAALLDDSDSATYLARRVAYDDC